MIDAPKILRTYLLSKTALTTLTGTRIWPERFNPVDGYTPSVGAAIAFRARPGRVEYSNAHLVISWQFKCYGRKPTSASETWESNANAVYRTLFDVLHDPKSNGIALTPGIVQALNELTGQTLHEPDTNWPYVLCFFETWMLAQAA